MLAAQSLEQVVFSALAADGDVLALLGGPNIYEEPRRNAAFPNITLAVTSSRDWSTGTEQGEEHQLTINVWTGAEGRLLNQKILNAIRSCLDLADLDLPQHTLINFRCETLHIVPDRKNRLFQGVLRYRAVTESRS
ncbi:MAG: DUF3168 domain-containing protein [Cohaesibacter sp.]|jgi:hypothetical protein|nr:DUF3168 domain-containing protein [Cohaesibacter sp.]